MDGAFVMMEWINSGDDFYFIKEMKTFNPKGEVFTKKRQFYGQTLDSSLASFIFIGIKLFFSLNTRER